MRISSKKLDLAMARACVGITDLRDVISSATVTKVRSHPDREISTKTIGKIAKRLGVDVTELIEEETA